MRVANIFLLTIATSHAEAETRLRIRGDQPSITWISRDGSYCYFGLELDDNNPYMRSSCGVPGVTEEHSPLPPPSPPPAPPPSPPDNIAMKEAISSVNGYTKASGCNAPQKYPRYHNFGNMDWHSCMKIASTKGLTAVPSDYTCGSTGWQAVLRDNDGYALTANGYSSPNWENIASSKPCCLGRHESYPGLPELDQLDKVATHNGVTWQYANLGSMNHEQCLIAATRNGASIITPSTVGLNFNTNTWVASVHYCNTYSWITNGNGGWGFETKGAYQWSSSYQCMIGRVTG